MMADQKNIYPIPKRIKINMACDLKGVVCADGVSIINDIESINYYYGKDHNGELTQEVLIKYKDKETKIVNKDVERIEIDANLQTGKNKEKENRNKRK